MRRALDLTGNTGMAVFYDHGPDLHPKNKRPAGERLALWALANDYGRNSLVHCGPRLDGVRIEGHTVIVRSDEVPKPVHVRYLFRKPVPDPEVSLVNVEGLPASSFMTDDLKPPREGTGEPEE